MNNTSLAAIGLRLRLALAALGPVLCGAVLLMLLSGAALVWLLPQGELQAERHRQAMRAAAMPPVATAVAAPVTANDNLILFYQTLGEKRHAEQQVRTLFALADKAGLALSQGEYKGAYERNAGLYTYQVTLPVKGSYDKVLQFGMLALAAIPFASLDEISFKRETIGDPAVEARLRLTLFMAADTSGGAR
ncbi:hypothetical protein KY495_01805 [Massilia sp. PAMC28688]|uniref:hypothetical protein n=1 Tax=Massilia sp. PAMC28688 TaxID=2861283 RepID=UPI001C632D10|nr:hypothetical protein [Massilia sp. PAMC28688]QYF93998.1 hypothetical protein KY495_01805 [Massilia sp. PAMC28688]